MTFFLAVKASFAPLRATPFLFIGEMMFTLGAKIRIGIIGFLIILILYLRETGQIESRMAFGIDAKWFGYLAIISFLLWLLLAKFTKKKLNR